MYIVLNRFLFLNVRSDAISLMQKVLSLNLAFDSKKKINKFINIHLQTEMFNQRSIKKSFVWIDTTKNTLNVKSF